MPDYYFASGRKATGKVERTGDGLRAGGRKVFGIPTRYLTGLSPQEKTERAAEIIRGRTTGRRDRNSPGDTNAKGERRETPESKHTKAFKRRFG